MPNIPFEKRLWINLTGESRAFFEKTLLPIAELKNHPEMPKECWDVETGEAFYCGCEGIGHNEESLERRARPAYAM